MVFKNVYFQKHLQTTASESRLQISLPSLNKSLNKIFIFSAVMVISKEDQTCW